MALTAGLLPLTAEAGTLNADGDVGQSPPSIIQQSTTSDTSGELSAIKIKTRPCSDFLKAQGSTSTFFPEVPDYVDWTNNPFTTFGLVDYAGLANKWIVEVQKKPSLGTKVTCLVTERALADGKAQINVALVATKALGFAQAAEDLFSAETIFGAKAQDVAAPNDPAEPALGPATLDVSFRITKADGLPDLVAVLVADPCKYKPVNFYFGSLTYQKSPQKTLRISQAGSTGKTSSCTGLIFSKEVVEITP